MGENWRRKGETLKENASRQGTLRAVSVKKEPRCEKGEKFANAMIYEFWMGKGAIFKDLNGVGARG